MGKWAHVSRVLMHVPIQVRTTKSALTASEKPMFCLIIATRDNGHPAIEDVERQPVLAADNGTDFTLEGSHFFGTVYAVNLEVGCGRAVIGACPRSERCYSLWRPFSG